MKKIILLFILIHGISLFAMQQSDIPSYAQGTLWHGSSQSNFMPPVRSPFSHPESQAITLEFTHTTSNPPYFSYHGEIPSTGETITITEKRPSGELKGLRKEGNKIHKIDHELTNKYYDILKNQRAPESSKSVKK